MKSINYLSTVCCSLPLWCLVGGMISANAQNPVSFQVDMTAQIANGSFDPGGGDQIQARGSFQGWTGGFWLTNSLADTNRYSGTYDIPSAPGTPFEYKFVSIKAGDDPNSWNNSEQLSLAGGNRSFTLAGGAQVLPLVYYANQLPTGATPTNPMTFQIDMAVQTAKGIFHAETGDAMEVRGEFDSNPWAGGNGLTNSPANTNLYTGTFLTAQLPGTQLAYKFVIVPGGGGAIWESIDNRVLVGPDTNGVVLPLAWFNHEQFQIPVTFQVDMACQVAEGHFDPNLDYVEARGSFQTPSGWAGGFVLTNDPGGANTNLYSGTYVVTHAPGTAEEYKFVVDSGSGLGWERPFSAGNPNRSFTVSSSAQTLPAVYFSDLGFNDMLATDTWVTFSVNMTNAVGSDGVHFDPMVNMVYLNGDFLGWWPWGANPPEYQLTNNPVGSEIYTLTLLVPKGNPIVLTYKYGIDGNDDESGWKTNHVRTIRTQETCILPLDTFGNQYVEPPFEASPIGVTYSGSTLTLNWASVAGRIYQVEYRTNLTQIGWLNLGPTNAATGAVMSATDAIGPDQQRFYRVVLLP